MGNTLNRPNKFLKSPNKDSSFISNRKNKSTKISSSQFWQKIKSNIVLKPKKTKENTTETTLDNKISTISNECHQEEMICKSAETHHNLSRNNICEFAEEEEETSVRGIEDIRKTWAGKTLTVDADKSKAGIKEFTLTFCKAYPQCGTNKALKEFLSSPNAAKDEFRIETDDPRTSGYTFGFDIN